MPEEEFEIEEKFLPDFTLWPDFVKKIVFLRILPVPGKLRRLLRKGGL